MSRAPQGPASACVADGVVNNALKAYASSTRPSGRVCEHVINANLALTRECITHFNVLIMHSARPAGSHIVLAATRLAQALLSGRARWRDGRGSSVIPGLVSAA